MKMETTAVPNVMILTTARFGDDLGWSVATCNAARMRAAGLSVNWVQDKDAGAALFSDFVSRFVWGAA